jgi:PleD family two-component response regulator
MLSSPSAHEPQRSSTLRRLLVVDDEEENLEIVCRTFRGEFEVHGARDGEEALRLARQIRPDVIISDQRMPNMTGVEFLTQIKDELPETVRILVTGYTDHSSLVDAVNEAHVDHYSEKPFHTVDIKTVVDALLQNKRLHNQVFKDGLTGLFNHRYLIEHLQVELARSTRYKYECCVLFLDIDGFKQVNDRFGHATGNKVLRRIAGLFEFRV